MVVCSTSWRAPCVSSTSVLKPYSPNTVEATELSDWSGQARTFSSRFIRAVASMATTSSTEAPGSCDSAARTSTT